MVLLILGLTSTVDRFQNAWLIKWQFLVNSNSGKWQCNAVMMLYGIVVCT